MISFNMLSALTRAQLSLWALLLCLVCIIGIAYSVYQKKYAFAVFALIIFVPAYFLWQITFDIYMHRKTGSAASISIAVSKLPYYLWFTILMMLTLAVTLLLILSFAYAKTRITPLTIKYCADKIPCGICYWLDSGRIIFSNICMNRLCALITGEPLLNGNVFCDMVSDKILTAGVGVWRFVCRDFHLDGEPLHELIAYDITEVYTKTDALKKETTELARLNRELQKHYQNIDDTVRRQEILQAKVNIHDKMNRLMLSTVSNDNESFETLDYIFSLWENNAMLLCMDADNESETASTSKLEQFAKELDIHLIWCSPIPDTFTKKQEDLFFTAAQEAVTNAAKHAGAENLNISFQESETALCCRFENDGFIPAGEARFTGGLANLALLADEQGASVSAESGKTFRLSLCFSKTS